MLEQPDGRAQERCCRKKNTPHVRGVLLWRSVAFSPRTDQNSCHWSSSLALVVAAARAGAVALPVLRAAAGVAV